MTRELKCDVCQKTFNDIDTFLVFQYYSEAEGSWFCCEECENVIELPSNYERMTYNQK